MQLAFSKQLAKDSNSVSTQGKEMLSLHVWTYCIHFYKNEIAVVAIKLHLFHVACSLHTVAWWDDFASSKGMVNGNVVSSCVY